MTRDNTLSVAQWRAEQAAATRCLIVPGKPVPAVRMTQRSKHRNRQAQRYLAYKDAIGWCWKEQHPGVEPFTGDVALRVRVYLADLHKRRWDISNVLKACEDALNQLAYLDDKQIVMASISVWDSSVWLNPDDVVKIEVEGTYT